MIRTQEIFVRRDDANVALKLQTDFEETPKLTLHIEFSNLILHEIEEWLGEDSISQAALKYVAVAVVHGGSRLVSKLMSFGSHIKILAPAYLREELVTECQRMVAYNN
jgi:predicted DNA-binding transcriptional regulator YafY